MQTQPLTPNAHSFERGTVYTVVSQRVGNAAPWRHNRIRHLRTVGNAHLFVLEGASPKRTKPDFLVEDGDIQTVEQH